MKGMRIAISVGIVVVLAVIVFSWYVQGVNRIVTLHEAVGAAWSQVETVLQRRADLIPNLVATVKGYAAHEDRVFTEVTELRSRWSAASGDREGQIQNAQEMSSALARLLVVAEQYPDLKANENFLSLQAQLEGTENRISVERNRYNEAVRAFNTEQRTFFGRFFAARRGLTKPEAYFEAPAAAREVPKVQF